MNPLSTPHDAHAPPLRRWPQTGYPAMLTATAAWHVLVLGAWLLAPRAWPWWLAAIFANHAVFTVAGLLPRTSQAVTTTLMPTICALAGQVAHLVKGFHRGGQQFFLEVGEVHIHDLLHGVDVGDHDDDIPRAQGGVGAEAMK